VSLINTIGRSLRRVGLRVPRLDAEKMLERARRRTGLADFGDPRFREGLDVVIRAFESRDTASCFGRLYFREFCVRLLVNRLKIQDTLTRNPEILDVPIVRPLVVTGLPRSGTTFLHRLLSKDPRARPLLLWETLEPTPPPLTETYTTDPRIDQARRTVAFLRWLAPGLDSIHEFDAEHPEECNNFFAHEFHSPIFGFLFDTLDYVRWLEDQDHVASYGYMKRQLQLLSWKCPGGGRWVLKAPAHLFSLDALLATFPDACVVVTHRDPCAVIASVCSLGATMREMVTERLDRRTMGAESLEALGKAPGRAIAARANLDPARFFDVDYRAMIADPIGTIKNIYAYFGDEFCPEFEAGARRWLADNQQHKHGVHRYRLEDFGLDAEMVNREFADYREWLARSGGSGVSGSTVSQG
jgi:hypothetical protein